MRFGPVPVEQAGGAILAHSVWLNDKFLRKGRVLEAADIELMARAGLARVTVARPGPDDVTEDAAAAALARALAPDPDGAGLTLTRPFTGRVNLNATGRGIVEYDPAAIHRLNRVHPEITLATLAPFTRVTPGLLVGTVKIISYAVPRAALDAACAAAAGALRVRPVALKTAGLILSEVAGQKPGLGEKGRKAIAARLDALGIDLAAVQVVPHETGAIAAALRTLPGEIALLLTGSATSDLHDTGPEAVRAAGGRVDRFGIPVDPGNLLFLGDQGGRPVIGLPGSARSPVLHGADWVLERVACGLHLTGDDIAAMGVGGLLKEIPSRPQPRERDRGQ